MFAHHDAANLPFGTKFVNVPMLKFDFLEAVQKFKKSLPDYYVETAWFDELKKACVILMARHKNHAMSLLYMQVDFLACSYRGVRKFHRYHKFAYQNRVRI